MTDHGDTFVCVECSRTIWRAIRQDTQGLCAECLHCPGWFDEPEIRAILDPDYSRAREAGELANPPPARPL